MAEPTFNISGTNLAKMAASLPSSGGSSSTTLRAPTGTTVKNSSGQLVNDQGNLVGGAVTASGDLSYGRAGIDPGATSNPVSAVDVYKNVPALKLPDNPLGQDYGALVTSLFPSLGTGTATKSAGTTGSSGAVAGTSTNLNGGSDDIFSQLLSIEANRPTPVKGEDIYNKTYSDLGVAQKQQAVNTLTGTLNGIVAQRDADLLRTRGTLSAEGGTEAVYGGIATTINREAAIKALPVAAQLDAAQGDLASAEKRLDTLFKIQVEDATAQYNYKNKFLDAISGILTKKEERIYNEKKEANARAYETEVRNTTTANDWAKAAAAGGQPELISSFTSLDAKSPTFAKDLARVQAKITSPMVKLEMDIKQANLDKIRKETQLLGEPSAADKKKAADALKEATASLPAMRDKIKAVDVLSEHSGLDSRVGTGILSRTPSSIGGIIAKGASIIGLSGALGDAYDRFSGSGQEFAGGVHQLVQGLTLQNLVDAKAQGATFGALSDAELALLAASATKISDWEIKDANNKGTGVWNIDEASFKRELNNIKELTNRAILLKEGTLIDDGEEALIDNVFNATKGTLQPANYY